MTHAMKLAIENQQLSGFQEISRDDVLDMLDNLRQQPLTAPNDDDEDSDS